MSTRANIAIVDEYSTQLFYRHSDGYPEGTMPTLRDFLELVSSKKIRDNVTQACGWLVILGQKEYENSLEICESGKDRYNGWKVGSYEPATSLSDDIEHLYVVNLNTLKIVHRDTKLNNTGLKLAIKASNEKEKE
jgi:hypothetical protein